MADEAQIAQILKAAGFSDEEILLDAGFSPDEIAPAPAPTPETPIIRESREVSPVMGEVSPFSFGAYQLGRAAQGVADSPAGQMIVPTLPDATAMLGLEGVTALAKMAPQTKVAGNVAGMIPGPVKELLATKTGRVLSDFAKGAVGLGAKFTGALTGREVGEAVADTPEDERLGVTGATLDTLAAFGADKFVRIKRLAEKAGDSAADEIVGIVMPTARTISEGVPSARQMRLLPEMTHDLRESARLLRREGAFNTKIRHPNDVYKAISNAQNEAGDRIGELVSNVSVPVPEVQNKINKLLKDLVDDVPHFGFEEVADTEQLKTLIRSELEQFTGAASLGEFMEGSVPLENLLILRRDWSDRIHWSDITVAGQDKLNKFFQRATKKLSGAIDELFDETVKKTDPSLVGELRRANATWGAAQDLLGPARSAVANAWRPGSPSRTRALAEAGVYGAVGMGASSMLGASPMLGAALAAPPLFALGLSIRRGAPMRGRLLGGKLLADEWLGLMPRSSEYVLGPGAGSFINNLTRLGVEANILGEAQQLIDAGNKDAMDTWLAKKLSDDPRIASIFEEPAIPGIKSLFGDRITDPVEAYYYGEQYTKENGYDPNLETRGNTNQVALVRRELNRSGKVIDVPVSSGPVFLRRAPKPPPTVSVSAAADAARVDKDH